jgi:hypothetical protein
VSDLADRLQELADGAAREVRPPGADLARRRGRRRRRLQVAAVALAAVLAVGLVLEGPLADQSAPAPPVGPDPGAGEEVPWPDPSSLRLRGVPEVGHGRLPGAASWRLQAGRYELANPDGTRDLVGNLIVAVHGRPQASAMRTFEEPVQLAVDTSMAYNEVPGLRVRPVFGAASPRAARVMVIPRRGKAVLAPIRAELVDGGSRLPARFWVAFLPAGGTPPQAVHQVRSYDAGGRELCRLDPDSLTPRCRG